MPDFTNELDFLKGIARGLGPDVVGGPVDLAEMVVNLGKAGYGTLGNKLGLLTPEQMPALSQASPGTSEWWAQKVNVPETGSGAYTAGRMAPLLGGLARMAGVGGPGKMAPASPQLQKGAIRVGGDPELMPAHQTGAAGLTTLLGEHKGVIELTSPSIAITRGHLNKDFEGPGGSVYLIPRVGAFDPAAYNTTLFNRDAYTSRHQNFSGLPVSKQDVHVPLTTSTPEGVTDHLAMLKLHPESKGYSMEYSFERAQKRLLKAQASGDLERFWSLVKDGSFPRISFNEKIWAQNAPEWAQDIYSDLNFLADNARRGHVGLGGRLDPKGSAADRLADRLSHPRETLFGEGVPGSASHAAAIHASPSFRSFADYERSPAGAATLLGPDQIETGHTFLASKASNKILDALVSRWGFKNREQAALALKQPLVSMEHNGGVIDAMDRLRDSYSTSSNGPEAKRLAELDFLRSISDARKRMSQVPSSYAELKAVGPQAITGENWAGAIFSNSGGGAPLLLQDALSRAKVPFTTAGNQDPELLFQIAKRLQEEAGPARRTPLK